MIKSSKLKKLISKIKDRMLVGSIYDNLLLKCKYNTPQLKFLYNVMIGQKHRMLYYKRLKKMFWKECTKERPWEQKEKEANPDTVWFCWLQGMEQAPELVRSCLESLKRNLIGKQIVLIDETNVFEYIGFPDYILEKWKKGSIGAAHFSDLIRLELLIRYGGYWIDSTVFCTDAKLLSYLDQLPIFLYSFYYFGFNPEIMEANNWFLYGTTNQNIFCLTREFLYCYWRKYNRAVDYFIFQLFLTMALEFYEEEYKNIPIISQVDAHILATYIFDSFNSNKFELVKAQTGFHKLSTRFDPIQMELKDTFYDKVIRKGEFS